jgi:1,4-dihydroxy-2-naphthoate octaprenyltransferase
VFVFAFFGIAAVVGSRYVHDATTTAAAWLLAVPVGFLVTAILVANNIRDIAGDAAAGKRTLAVRLGRRNTRVLYGFLILGAFAAILGYAVAGLTPPGTLLALLALPLALRPVRIVTTAEAGPDLIAALRATARLHFLVGALLGIGAAL